MPDPGRFAGAPCRYTRTLGSRQSSIRIRSGQVIGAFGDMPLNLRHLATRGKGRASLSEAEFARKSLVVNEEGKAV